MANIKYDWETAEQFFLDLGEESEISLKGISERFNIPYQTVRRYAAAHKWHSKRYRAWIKEKHGVSFAEHLKALEQEVMNRD
jgi:predicted 3-demethylubiquinone-9 3-methyltransferase (glyoxalase superfamily)